MTSIAISTNADLTEGRVYEPIAMGGIVAGVDGSPESLAAFTTASTIASACECAMHIVSVVPSSDSYRLDPSIDQNESEIDSLRINIREMGIKAILEQANPDHKWTHEIVSGRVPRAIVAAAENRLAEFIVIGKRRHVPMDKFLGGETTLQVIRMSAVPVLAVEKPLGVPRSVVVATDFSQASTFAARLALELMGNQGTLYLVHVEPVIDVELVQGGIPQPLRFPGDLVLWFRRQVQDLDVPNGVIVETAALSGKPAQEVLEFAARAGADLIATGAHRQPERERFLLGSVSTAIARNAECAVLVAPPQLDKRKYR